MDHTRVGPAPTRYLPLPVVVAGGAMRVCSNRTHAPGLVLFCGDAPVATGFLIMAHPSFIWALGRGHVRWYSLHLTVKLAVYKGNEAGRGPTRIVTIPAFGPTDHLLLFFSFGM